MAVRYEWDIETVTEHGDVEDHWHADKLSELEPIEKNQTLVLVRDIFDDMGLVDRQWAYVFDGVLPTLFDGGIKVPKKFAREFAASDFNGGA